MKVILVLMLVLPPPSAPSPVRPVHGTISVPGIAGARRPDPPGMRRDEARDDARRAAEEARREARRATEDARRVSREARREAFDNRMEMRRDETSSCGKCASRGREVEREVRDAFRFR